ncbi:MAG: hypothetical protein NC248_04465 [Bacteroides sp.]|nr:hypothetical protein [Bacteroides sp.]MCM1390749.1 hypothetical protein [Bacteroides sp.]
MRRLKLPQVFIQVATGGESYEVTPIAIQVIQVATGSDSRDNSDCDSRDNDIITLIKQNIF